MSSRDLHEPGKRSRWSLGLGRPFGIQLRVHATFLLLIAWVVVEQVMAGAGWRSTAAGVAYVIAVFVLVVLHELAHALTARHYGIPTRDILLLPIGGMSRMERIPTEPRQEILVAIAGPALNVVLALVFFLVMLATGGATGATQVDLLGGSWVSKLMWTNVALAGFNLLPAFPMDGGRVLRGLLARRMEYSRATDVAVAVGKVAAVGMGVVGILSNPLLVLIALFIWFGGYGEARLAHLRASLAGIPVSRAMITRFVAVGPGEPLSRVADYLLRGGQDDVPVVEAGHLLGVVGLEDVVRASGGGDGPVSSVMHRHTPTVSEDDPLEVAFETLGQSARRSLPVLHGDRLVGLLLLQNIAQVVRARQQASLSAGRAAH